MRRTKSTRGLTLIELMIGTLIAAFLTAAAFAFAAHETRLMGVSTERVELSQTGRHAIDLIADDLRQAGAGIGYGERNALMAEAEAPGCPAGNRCFRGLLYGQFNFAGRAFNTVPNGALQLGDAGAQGIDVDVVPVTDVGARDAIGTNTYNVPSQAFGVRMANGSHATIVDFQFGGGAAIFHCLENSAQTGVPTTFQANELAVVRHEDHIFGRSVLITGPGPLCGPANNAAKCRFGCSSVAYAADPDLNFASDAGADTASYLGGELVGGLKTIVWLNMPNPNNGTGRLYRAVFDGQSCPNPLGGTDLPAVVPAPGGPAICAGRVADEVEALNIRVWRWDAAAVPPAWVHVPQAPIIDSDRLRVDVELVVRGRKSESRRAPTRLDLIAGTCVPDPTCAVGDSALRRAYRTSVDIVNSGRMTIQR